MNSSRYSTSFHAVPITYEPIDLDGGDDQAGDQRAGHVAEPAQHDGDVGDQHELEPDRRIDGVDRREQHAGHADAGDADRPGEREDAAGVDPHERRRRARSCAVARMTLPVYDQRMKAKSAAVESTATANATIWARLSTAPPRRTTTA